MPSTSKSKRQKPKEQQQEMQPKTNWLELPSDLMANILFRVGVFDILENVEKVCTAWRKICKDPSMWRVICIDYPDLRLIEKNLAVSSQLRRLKIKTCDTLLCKNWTEALKKFPLLEELTLYYYDISKEVVETVGCCCPLLKTLKLNKWESRFFGDYVASCDKIAIAIGENFHELEHLELTGNQMSKGCRCCLSASKNSLLFGLVSKTQTLVIVVVESFLAPPNSVTMPSTSKCSKSKRQKTKEQWQVGMQPTRNWLELPSDVMASILSRVGLHDIIKNAEKVCTAWQKICKDPSMWRVICIDNPWKFLSYERFINLCKHAVDRSQGQLIDITIGHFEIFGDFELLQYVADRSSRLRRLKIRTYYSSWCRSWTDPLKKFPLLEEFSLHSYHIPKEVVETVGCYCPLLKTFKLSTGSILCNKDDVASCDKMAITIGENFHELEQLQLIGNKMTNIGLQAILDGCRNLKSLDLRMCPFIDLKGDLGKECSQQIKCLKLSDDPWWFVYVFDSSFR
ncbi:hypothetical protein OSB04_un000456 [Centaurea solstitialis]|uniref:F-box domain-containing protein n=1 Tax=Centaurea solstitialis TaxID=347529 RepID=A0AA38S673_9ASTR|nr:hypothetical protein OSB04_un000456 [Centaurea solstitialis]